MKDKPVGDEMETHKDVGTLMTLTEVAEALRVSERTVRRAGRTGDMRLVRVGRTVRFRRRDVEAFIASNLSGGA